MMTYCDKIDARDGILSDSLARRVISADDGNDDDMAPNDVVRVCDRCARSLSKSKSDDTAAAAFFAGVLTAAALDDDAPAADLALASFLSSSSSSSDDELLSLPLPLSLSLPSSSFFSVSLV